MFQKGVAVMCLAVPLKIISTDGKNAVGEANGIRQNVRIDFLQDLSIGDYVMVHAGFAIAKMSGEEAEETLSAISEVNKAAEG